MQQLKLLHGKSIWGKRVIPYIPLSEQGDGIRLVLCYHYKDDRKEIFLEPVIKNGVLKLPNLCVPFEYWQGETLFPYKRLSAYLNGVPMMHFGLDKPGTEEHSYWVDGKKKTFALTISEDFEVTMKIS